MNPVSGIFGMIGALLGGVLHVALTPLRVFMRMSGCGCLLSLISLAILFVLIFGLGGYFLGFQHVGPRVQAGQATVEGSDGTERVVPVSEDFANAFEVKIAQAQTNPGTQVVRVSIGEAEINSKLMRLLKEKQAEDPGFPVRSVFLVIHPDQLTFYGNGHELGRDIGVKVGLRAVVTEENTLDLSINKVQIGSLPALPFSRQIGDILLNAVPFVDDLEESLPEHVEAIEVGEGRISLDVIPTEEDVERAREALEGG